MDDFYPLSTGTLLRDRYSIEDILGRGGMGAVYRAKDALSGQNVALKQTFHGAVEELRLAFHQEAKLLARLQHPAVPIVTDYFIDGTSQFLVMELIDGTDLSAGFDSVGNAEPVSLEYALEIANQLFSVLEYLHAQGIVHRDIKPANLRMTPNGQLRLLDFGAAKGSLTETTALKSIHVATPRYAPPEQIYHTGTDETSDVFSAAATIYHLLSGTPPPSAPQRESAIRTGSPDPLLPIHEIITQIPKNISLLLQSAMELVKEKRCSVQEVLRVLNPISQIEDLYSSVARILDLIAIMPNSRADYGGYTYFDGGEARFPTGEALYTFSDGSTAASYSNSGFADFQIQLANGIKCRVKGVRDTGLRMWDKERVAETLALLSPGRNPLLDDKYGSPANKIDDALEDADGLRIGFVDNTRARAWFEVGDKSDIYFVRIIFSDVPASHCKEVLVEIEVPYPYPF